jgi:hypothetical protein
LTHSTAAISHGPLLTRCPSTSSSLFPHSPRLFFSSVRLFAESNTTLGTQRTHHACALSERPHAVRKGAASEATVNLSAFTCLFRKILTICCTAPGTSSFRQPFRTYGAAFDSARCPSTTSHASSRYFLRSSFSFSAHLLGLEILAASSHV